MTTNNSRFISYQLDKNLSQLFPQQCYITGCPKTHVAFYNKHLFFWLSFLAGWLRQLCPLWGFFLGSGLLHMSSYSLWICIYPWNVLLMAKGGFPRVQVEICDTSQGFGLEQTHCYIWPLPFDQNKSPEVKNQTPVTHTLQKSYERRDEKLRTVL